METNQKIQYGLIGILTVIVAAFGGYQYFTPEQLDNLYVCTTNQNLGYFDYLSSTAKTGYWTENETTQSLVCRNGYWINIKDYAQENNVSIASLLIPEEEPEEIPIAEPGTKYLCSPTKCTRIE